MKDRTLGGNHNLIIHLFITAVLIFVTFVAMFAFALSVKAQAAGDIIITEVMYEPLAGGDWVEIFNTSSSAVDITALKIIVGSVENTIAVDGATNANLVAGAGAVIVADATAFKSAYAPYTGAVYVASAFALPNESTVSIVLKKSTTEIHTTTYSSHPLTHRTGASLHKTLGSVFRPAPATPGEIAINPITERASRPVASSVSTEVSNGDSVDGDDEKIYLDSDSTIIIRVLDQRSLDSVSATLIIGDNTPENRRTLTLSTSDSTGVQKVYKYDVQGSDPSGVVKYEIVGANDKSGKLSNPLTGIVRHENKQAVIDKAAPTASVVIDPAGSAVRKIATITVVEDNPTDTISYRIGTSTCGTKIAYDAVAANTGAEIPLEKTNAGLKAEVRLFGSDLNGKYLCVKAKDKKGQEGYAVSAAISGMADASLVISELMYASVHGASHEWIEVTNVGSSAIDLTNYDLMDGGTRKTISYVSGGTTISSGGGTAIIARNVSDFETDHPSYGGPLFSASFSLNDSGDTISLRTVQGSSIVDTAVYKKTDGAYKNEKSIHRTNKDEIFEAVPSPGEKTEELESLTQIKDLGKEIYPENVLAKVVSFNGSAITEGQNLFFTSEGSAEVSFVMSDESTDYTTSTIDDYLTLDVSASVVSSYRVVEESVTAGSSAGEVRVSYTVYFSIENGAVKDNRVTIYPKLKDGDDNYNTKRAAVTVVRNTTAPTLKNSGSASVLGFYSNTKVITPVGFSGAPMGDWLTLGYGGSCGDGLLSYIARNGVQGVSYLLGDAIYIDCSISATDSAGNVSNTLSLPKIIVGRGS